MALVCNTSCAVSSLTYYVLDWYVKTLIKAARFDLLGETFVFIKLGVRSLHICQREFVCNVSPEQQLDAEVYSWLTWRCQDVCFSRHKTPSLHQRSEMLSLQMQSVVICYRCVWIRLPRHRLYNLHKRTFVHLPFFFCEMMFNTRTVTVQTDLCGCQRWQVSFQWCGLFISLIQSE